MSIEILLRVSISELRHGEGCLSYPENRRKSCKSEGCKVFFATLDPGSVFHIGKKTRTKLDLLASWDFRPMQCDSHTLETDVTCTNKSNEKLWELGHVLRGQRGYSKAKS